MQSIHFLKPENQEWDKINLNNLQPVSEYQKQVIFDIVENKLDGKILECFNERFEGEDKKKALEKYRILGKYSDMYKIFNDVSFNFIYLENYIKNLFNVNNEFNERFVDFLYEKNIFSDIKEFSDLVNKKFFKNIDFEIFRKNFEYLEKQFGFKIEIENLSEYIISFLKYGDIDNLDFIYNETLKLGFNISLYNFLSFLHFEGIEFREYLSFISQPGLSEKVQYFYDKKGEEFNIKYYFDKVHNYSDIDNLENNTLGKFDKFLVDKKNKTKNIEKFKITLDLIINKYPNLELTKDIFDLVDNLGENIFLFEEFDISEDYFKNENSEKFFNFLIISSTKLLKLLILNINGIKFKDLFNIFKINSNLFTSFFTRNIEYNLDSNEYEEFFINFFRYAVSKQNYYFLENNLNLFTKLYENRNINYDFGFKKIEKILDKTGGFITKSLFENYVLQEDSDLDEIWEKYKNAMKKVLSSEKIKQEELGDFLYEAIFMAYRPTGFSEEEIKKMIENGEIKDLTHQLDEIRFNKKGYNLIFVRNELNFEGIHGKLFDEIRKFLGNDSIGSNFEYVENLDLPEMVESVEKEGIFNNLNIKKFYSKVTEIEELEDIIQRFFGINNDPRLDNFRNNEFALLNVVVNDKNLYYEYLNNSYEIFGVVTKDSFLKYILKELEKQEDKDIENIFARMQKIKDSKFKKEFENVSNENVTDKNDIKIEEKKIIIAKLTEKRIIEFGQFMRKRIKQELKKFKIIRGEEKEFKAIISKNIGSFFAKAGAELCTANDKNMWKEQRHIHLNLIDEEKNQIVGNIMLYFEENRDYLIVRGFNPIRQIVDNYDNKQLVSEMIRVVKQIAKENGFDRVYIPKVNWAWHNLSNRDKIQKLVWNESQKNSESNDYIIENAGFYQTSILDLNNVDELYLL